MENITLRVTERQEIGKRLNLLRQKGFIPCVIYGEKKGVSLPLKIEKKELLKILHTHRLESSIFTLIIENQKPKKSEVMIKDIQYHPLTGDILHLDFYAISLKKSIKLKVPLIPKGESIGVKQGGLLDRLFWELEVECLPAQIPKEIEVDISDLKIGDSVYIKDLKLPKGVKILEDPESICFTISAPKEVIEVKPEEVVEKAEPEVIKKEKEEKEEKEE